ncbi:MAG: protein-glutamate O-methyltransferase CheR [Candidatus Thermoplasmatota archaeon]
MEEKDWFDLTEELESDTDSEGFRRLMKEISRRIGVDYTTYSKRHLRRRFHARMKVVGEKTFSGYLGYVRNNEEEIEKLKDLLTVNVTKFKRNKKVWRIIQDGVIPTVLESKREEIFKKVKCWSAGCATGEEPYSLAISYLENGGIRGMDFKIEATDLDEGALEFARKGEYPPKAVENLSEQEKRNYFKKMDGTWKVKDEVRELVDFRCKNIFKTDFSSRYDLILCRNLMIYFNREAKNRLTERLIESLKRNGLLILGMSETLSMPARDLVEKYDIKSRIYRKKAED